MRVFVAARYDDDGPPYRAPRLLNNLHALKDGPLLPNLRHIIVKVLIAVPIDPLFFVRVIPLLLPQYRGSESLEVKENPVFEDFTWQEAMDMLVLQPRET